MQPNDFRGGILADEMGLGKTLTMIANIVSSRRHALDFAVAKAPRMSTDCASDIIPSKATLVVVPSARTHALPS